MKIRVLFFASLRERVQRSSLDLDVAPGTTVAALWAQLCEQYPAIASLSSSVSFALNEEYVDRTAEIPDGAELALIPPVSGG